MEIFVILILISILVLLLFAWQELHTLRESAKAALSLAASAVQTQYGAHGDINAASRDLARHERSVHQNINREWSRASGRGRPKSSFVGVSHLGQSFPNLGATELYKDLTRNISTERGDVERKIADAASKVNAYNVALQTLPGCLLSSMFSLMEYAKYDSLRPVGHHARPNAHGRSKPHWKVKPHRHTNHKR